MRCTCFGQKYMQKPRKDAAQVSCEADICLWKQYLGEKQLRPTAELHWYWYVCHLYEADQAGSLVIIHDLANNHIVCDRVWKTGSFYSGSVDDTALCRPRLHHLRSLVAVFVQHLGHRISID